MAWEAMQQPYCGFGAFGASAAQKSFTKTLTRARTNYLAQVKKSTVPPVAPKAAATTPIPAKVAPVTTPTVKKTPVSTTKVQITRTLQRGQSSAEVKALQSALVQQGFLSQENATGYFGAITESALIDFQIKRGLVTSRTAAGAGLVGPKTRAALNS